MKENDLEDAPNLKFREDRSSGQVVVLDGSKELYRHSEYKGSAEWAKRTYNLTDAELMDLYRDYKTDYDS